MPSTRTVPRGGGRGASRRGPRPGGGHAGPRPVRGRGARQRDPGGHARPPRAVQIVRGPRFGHSRVEAPAPACKLGRAVPPEGSYEAHLGRPNRRGSGSFGHRHGTGIGHGGSVPKGRAAEDGPLRAGTASAKRPRRTKRNVADSDAILLISHGPLTGGSKLPRTFAAELGKPVLHVELSKLSVSATADRIARWLGALECRTLNVAGPRASEEAAIYAAASAVLRRAISEHLGRQREDDCEASRALAANR